MPPVEATSHNLETSPRESLDRLDAALDQHRSGAPIARAQVAQDLTNLYLGLPKKAREKDPKVAAFFQLFKPLIKDPDTGEQLIDDPDVLKLIYQIPKPKLSLKTKAALGTATLGATIFGLGIGYYGSEIINLKANGGPVPITYDGSKLFPSETLIVTPTKSPTSVPVKTPETQKPPENLFNEFIKPFVDEAMAKREIWKNTDPEYSHIIDQELNANRLNIVVFGYGEEHGESYEDYGGAPSILSLDLKTNKIAIVHFSRDIRAPELERLLPENQRQPTSIRSVYRMGGKNEDGFKQMRYLIGEMSGLVADYQVIMKDLTLRNVIVKLTDGSLEIDVPKDHNTGPFRLDRVRYGDGSIKQGKQIMDTATLMRYVLAEDKNPAGKQDERSYRKNQVTEALIEKIQNKMKEGSMLDKIGFLNQIRDFTDNELKSRNIELDFNPNLISKSFEGILRMAAKVLGNFGQNIEMTVPEIDKTKEIVFHDPSFGDGGVTRVHNLANSPNTNGRKDNLKILEEVNAHKLPDWMLIPDGGNPYSNDLVRDYWFSTRTMVKKTLSGTPH